MVTIRKIRKLIILCFLAAPFALFAADLTPAQQSKTVYDSFLLELRPANPVADSIFHVWYYYAGIEFIRWGATDAGKYENIVPYWALGETETLYAPYYDMSGNPISTKKELIINYR
ncbi:MAG: hypothetical protein LBT83_05340 [Tannerella sp.]|jgi:hypothetical protein|nr:hypothetical protein [Tannerella sp.]